MSWYEPHPFPRFRDYAPSIAIPSVYWDVESPEQRIRAICEILGRVICYADEMGIEVTRISELLAEIEAGHLDPIIEAAIEEWFRVNEPGIMMDLRNLQDAVYNIDNVEFPAVQADIDTLEHIVDEIRYTPFTLYHEFEKVATLEIPEGHSVSGMVGYDNHLYVYHRRNDSEPGYISKYSLSDYSLVNTYSLSFEGHGNDMSYEPYTTSIILLDDSPNTAVVYNPYDFSVKTQISLTSHNSGSVHGLAFSEDGKYYAANYASRNDFMVGRCIDGFCMGAVWGNPGLVGIGGRQGICSCADGWITLHSGGYERRVLTANHVKCWTRFGNPLCTIQFQDTPETEGIWYDSNREILIIVDVEGNVYTLDFYDFKESITFADLLGITQTPAFGVYEPSFADVVSLANGGNAIVRFPNPQNNAIFQNREFRMTAGNYPNVRMLGNESGGRIDFCDIIKYGVETPTLIQGFYSRSSDIFYLSQLSATALDDPIVTARDTFSNNETLASYKTKLDAIFTAVPSAYPAPDASNYFGQIMPMNAIAAGTIGFMEIPE